MRRRKEESDGDGVDRTMLSDTQWERIEPLRAGRQGGAGRTGRATGRFAEAVAPPKANRAEAVECDMEKYGRRCRVENFFRRIKNFRHIATRYDRTESSYPTMILVAACLLALA